MKKLFTLMLALTSLAALAQAPQNISYQAIARLSNGSPISNQAISVKIMIYQGSVGSVLSYEETHTVNTNQFGLFTLFIGGGTPTIGTFNTINWATGSYFVETLIDPAGGSSYSSLGTQQLMSVPYALYAEKVGNASPTPTLTINAPNTITNPTTGVYNISVPSYSYTGGTGIAVSSGSIINTAPAITPTIVGMGLATVNPTTGNSFTVSVPSPSLSLGGGLLSISGGNSIPLPTHSLSVNSNSLTINGPGGNTVLLPSTPTTSLTQGALNNITINGSAPSYTISANTYSLSFPTYSTSLLTNGTNTTTAIVPPALLSLSGTILSSGAPTNSVDFSTIPSVWTKSLTSIYPSSITNWVGIGTSTPNNLFQVKDYISFENNGSNTLLGHNTTTLTSTSNGCYANTFVGYDAGGSIINNANNNTFMGWHSGVGNSNGANNTFMGSYSGINNSSGSNNTFIGTGADLSSTIQRTNATAIGYNAKVDTNNAVVLGAVFPGINVGIGTTKPASSLHITNSAGSQIRFGHNNQPTREWYFDVDATAHMGLRNENNGTALSVMDFDNNNGNIGIGTGSPLSKLHVNGAISITDGTQGVGKVLISNASGIASWAPIMNITYGSASCQSIATVSTTPVKFATNLGTFTKSYLDTHIEVTLQTDLNVFNLVGSNSVVYQIKVNGIAANGNTGKAVYFINNAGALVLSNNKGVSMIAEFDGLAAGTYSVELWASCPFGGSASSVYIDPGCFGSSSVVIKEFK